MEEVAEGIVRIAAQTILVVVRFLIWFTWEVMCETVLWYIGWPVVRAVTLGKFPKQSITDSDSETPLMFFLVAITGLVSLVFAAFVLVKFLGQ